MQFTSIEEAEINIAPEDLPNLRLAKDLEATEDNQIKDQTPMEIAKAFLHELEKALLKGKPEDVLYLYDRKFNKISDTSFKATAWPTATEVEESSDEEFDLFTNFLYTELCNRHIYTRLLTFGPEVRLNAFENYIQLFDAFIESKEEIAIPAAWIWDILDEFLYQYQIFCQYRAKMKDEDANLEYFLKHKEDLPTLEKVTDVFKKFIDKSKVIKNGKLEDLGPKPRALQYFGYYSIIALMKLHVLTCDYEAALRDLEPVDFPKLSIYTKAFPCLVTFFYYAGYAYLMSKRYKESVKLFELILSCFLKYKQFYSKSFQFEAVNKLAEKSLLLLGIAQVFYPLNIDETVAANLRERFIDRLDKINKYDLRTFDESFNYGSPKLIIPIKDSKHFEAMGFDLNIMETVHQQRDILSQEFSRIQNLNNLTGVLKLYDTIKLDKLAKVLKITQDQLKELITLYQGRNSSNLKNVPFEQSIIKKLLESVQSLDFKITGDTVSVISNSTKLNFTKLFTKNIHKIEEITHDLEIL